MDKNFTRLCLVSIYVGKNCQVGPKTDLLTVKIRPLECVV